jgi:hypothetical protein
MIAPIHQTYAGLGLVLFAAASSVSRPEVFATAERRIILVGAGLVYVVREHFLERFDLWVQIICALGLVVAALLFFRVVCSAQFAAFRQRRLGKWLDRELAWDAAILIGFVVLVTLVSWAGDQLMQNGITRRYVWANLPIRTLSFVRLPVFIACFWLVLTRLPWLTRGRGQGWLAATCALSCLVLSWIWVSEVDRHAWKRQTKQMAKSLAAARDRRIFDPNVEEARIYAHLAMVAAGELEPAAAESNLVAQRRIKCAHRH